MSPAGAGTATVSPAFVSSAIASYATRSRTNPPEASPPLEKSLKSLSMAPCAVMCVTMFLTYTPALATTALASATSPSRFLKSCTRSSPAWPGATSNTNVSPYTSAPSFGTGTIAVLRFCFEVADSRSSTGKEKRFVRRERDAGRARRGFRRQPVMRRDAMDFGRTDAWKGAFSRKQRGGSFRACVAATYLSRTPAWSLPCRRWWR